MGSLDAKDAVIRKQVKSVQFGFYTDNDVLTRSVIHITSPQAFDPNGTSLPQGLYDPRLGPIKQVEPCPTCAARDCPGHFGHISLAVPVYQPLLFPALVKILRAKCWACHALRAERRPLRMWQVQYKLWATGQLAASQELESSAARVMNAAREGAPMAASQVMRNRASRVALDDYLSSVSSSCDDRQSPSPLTATSAYQQYYRQHLLPTGRERLAAKTCHACGAVSPKIRQDSNAKIFQSPLSVKQQRLNASKQGSIEFVSALDEQQREKERHQREQDQGDGSDREVDGDVRMAENGYNSDETDRDDEGDSDSSDDDTKDADEVGEIPQPRDKYLHPGEVEAQLKRTWELDPFVCNALFGCSGDLESTTDYSYYFVRKVAVPPSRFRPPMTLGDMTVEHGQTQSLSQIISLNESVRTNFKSGNDPKAYSAWIELQTVFNCFVDSSKDPSGTGRVSAGIKQILERKEGLFRKNMMGKRVDYACRSVISPDPYVGTNEIGLPFYFATMLTYPTPVTDRNAREMRLLVERGPVNYPGTRWVEFHGKRMDLSRMNRHRREAVAAQLLTHVKKGGMPAIIGRQLRDGDYVLMNRQPTLHKPGIMAHRVRVLYNRNQRTIRMHYANCNTYNADFDGDEMNCHFPQSYLAQAEAQYIANTDEQYIVPTDGSPLRGLIQDHVVGGVKLTKRDTFLELWEFQQLLFAAVSTMDGLEILLSDSDLVVPPPAVRKPRQLWTGKQVISSLLFHLSEDKQGSRLSGIHCERKSKTPESAFGKCHEEHLVLIRDGELLRGVLDKAAFGATGFSLVHAVFEVYGPEKAGLLLNMLGRLFTAYIQYFAGHSCRVEDLVLSNAAEAERQQLLANAYNAGSKAAKAWADSEGGKTKLEVVHSNENIVQPMSPTEESSAASKIGELLSGREGKENFATLDGFMQSQLNPLASAIVKRALPGGLKVPFPYNTFGVMTATGAKGSIVNQSQVTCCLGQQALEGRRVPRMNSGRTLPSFIPYDPNPRADGFVLDRFLTGIRPQEYYFHCMAGREGLVDTAVKTSRSGYLQRCLVKHLEDLKICYDLTVRNSEGAVIQFVYGEDGLDPTKASYLDCSNKSFEFMARNLDSLKLRNRGLPSSSINAALVTVTDVARDDGDIRKGDIVCARRLGHGLHWTHGSLCHGWHDAVVTKVRKKSFDLKYCSDDELVHRVPRFMDIGVHGRTEQLLSSKATIVRKKVLDPVLTDGRNGRSLGTSGECVSERVATQAHEAMTTHHIKDILSRSSMAKEEFSTLVAAKYSCSLGLPGEAVGSIAAQSVGEPSTQMTLNTFHLAGSGANVTLGIPRLREILMTASRDLKTPTMSIPVHDFVSPARAGQLVREFTTLSMHELVACERGIAVTERLERIAGASWQRAYYVRLKLHPAKKIADCFGLSLEDVAKVVSENFIPLLSKQVKKQLKAAGDSECEIGQASVGVSSPMGVNEAAAESTNNDTPDERQMHADELNDDEDEYDNDDNPGEEDGIKEQRFSNRRESAAYDSDSVESAEGGGGRSRNLAQSGARSTTIESSVLLDNSKTALVERESNTIVLPPIYVDPEARPLLIVGIVEKVAATILVRSKKNISEAYLNEEKNRGLCLQTSGVNFTELWNIEDIVHNKLQSNDIWAIRCSYGVEAARKNIVQQITSVFGAYGIEIDARHLSLIADYMTFDGGFKALNRTGMEDCSSSLLQMSFETTVHFLQQAAVHRKKDDLVSPSANIVLGRPIKQGTGSFSLLANS